MSTYFPTIFWLKHALKPFNFLLNHDMSRFVFKNSQSSSNNSILSKLFYLVKDNRLGIRDVFISGIPQVFTLGTGLLISIILAKKLGPSILGQYALVMSVAGIVASLSDMGIGQTAIRYAARALAGPNPETHFQVLRWAFRLRMTLVLLVVGVAYFLAPTIATRAWHQPSLGPLIQLSLLIGIFSAIAAIPAIYFQSLKRFTMNSIVQVAQALIKIVGILFLAWWNTWSLEHVIAVTIVSTVVGASIMLFLVPSAALFSGFQRRKVLTFIERIKGVWRNPIKEELETEASSRAEKPNSFAFYMFLSSLMVMITTQMDVWLMGYYLNTEMVGKFHVAMRVMLPLTFFINALSTALWPRAAIVKTTAAITGLVKRTLRLTLLALVPLLLYSVFMPMLIPHIFGSQYDDIVLLTQLACLRFCTSILISPISLIGYNLGLVRRYSVMNVVNLVVLVGIEVFFLNRIGFYAPVLAKTVTTFTSMFFLLPPAIKYYKQHWNK